MISNSKQKKLLKPNHSAIFVIYHHDEFCNYMMAWGRGIKPLSLGYNIARHIFLA